MRKEPTIENLDGSVRKRKTMARPAEPGRRKGKPSLVWLGRKPISNGGKD